MLPLSSPVVVLTAVLTAFSAIFVVHRRLSQPQCHGQRRSKLYLPKNQAKRNSIASSFLDCGCGTGNRSAFHNLSRMCSVALSQIVRIAVMNRLKGKFVSRGSQEYSYQLSRKENARTRIVVEESMVREAGQRSSAETLSDVIHSGENEAENGFRSTRNDWPRSQPKLFKLNFFLVPIRIIFFFKN